MGTFESVLRKIVSNANQSHGKVLLEFHDSKGRLILRIRSREGALVFKEEIIYKHDTSVQQKQSLIEILYERALTSILVHGVVKPFVGVIELN